MPMTLDPALYDGAVVPLRYDLLCDHTEKAPAFYFVCRPDMLIEERLVRLAELYGPDPRLGSFGTGDELGFGGVFVACELPSYPDGFKAWRAEVPNRTLGTLESDNEEGWLAMKRPQITLCVLESVLQYEEAPSNDMELQQLFIVQAMCEQKMHGASMAATLSPAFRQWIETNRGLAESTARQAMVTVAEWMWPDYFSGDKFSRGMAEREYRVWHHEDGRGLMIDVPGNATGIYVDGHSLNDGPGWHLDCHNLDTVIQQLELLAGLCTMLRLVRESQLPNR